MAFKDIRPGSYKAKAVRGGIGKAKTGTLQVAVEFAFDNGEHGVEKIWWIGYLTDKAKERAIGTLAMLNFEEKYESDPTGESTMFAPGALDTNKEVEIVIEMEPNPNKDNQLFPRVKWVNELGGARFSGLPVQELKRELAGINFAGELAAARASLGMPAKPKATTAAINQPIGKTEDLPF